MRSSCGIASWREWQTSKPLRGTPHVDPTAAIAISFEGTTTEGVQGRHERHISLQREAPALEKCNASLEPDEDERRAILRCLEDAARRPVVLMRRAHVYPSQLQAVLAIVERFPDTVVVSVREPFDSELVPNARHLFAAYGDDDACIGAVADVLFGNVAPTGTLPVELHV